MATSLQIIVKRNVTTTRILNRKTTFSVNLGFNFLTVNLSATQHLLGRLRVAKVSQDLQIQFPYHRFQLIIRNPQIAFGI